MKKYYSFFILHFLLCLAMLVWGVPLQAQQDDFDPVLPPDPDASYSVSVTSDLADGAVLTGEGAFNAGATTYVSCTPNEGYVFDYWTLDGTRYSTDPAFTYTVEHNSVVFVAHLQSVSAHTLSVSTNLPDAAAVTGAGEYYPTHTVQVSCTPNKDYNFQYWTLNGIIYSYDLSFTYEMGSTDAAFVAVLTHTPHYTVTAKPDDASAGYVVADSGEYLSGEILNFEAYAYDEYTFAYWTLNGMYFTDQPAFTYTVGTTNAAFVAVFDFNPEQPDDPALVLTSAVYVKSDPMGAATFNIKSGTKYHEGDTLIIRATMSDDYIFDGWYHGDEKVASTTAFTYIVGQKDVTFTLRATPIVYSQLNLVSSPAEAVTFNILSGNIYREHTTLSLRASVVAGYVFRGWYLGDSLLTETTDLQYTIGTTAATLTAKATVIEPNPDEDWDPLPPSDPEMESVYIIAQSANSATGKAYGSASYVVGKEAILRAVPAHGYMFSHWDDGNTDSVRTIIASVDITYTAYFTPLTYTVTVLSDNDEAGSVSGSGIYAYRSSATITATPATGYKFLRWSDDNTDPTHIIYITSDTMFTAFFAELTFVITALTADSTAGIVQGGGTYQEGETVVLTATPLGNNTFLQWDDGNTDNPRTITTTGDATYIALFSASVLPPDPEPTDGDGALTGKFPVSATKYVVFSQGNLQYNPAAATHQCADGSLQQGTWRFAENQYDYAGAESNTAAAPDYDGWIDMFGWGTSGWQSGAEAYLPWDTTTTAAAYQPLTPQSSLIGDAAYADWGVYNAISNGGNTPNLWRTLSANEWTYLFRHTPWTMAHIQVAEKTQIRGFAFLPEDFIVPEDISITLLGTGEETANIRTFKLEDYAANTYTLEQFAALQEAGLVFLPCAGTREKGQAGRCGTIGGYWSSTASDPMHVRGFYFYSARVDAFSWPLRSLGYSVRLVKDYVEPDPDIPTASGNTPAEDTSTATKVLYNGHIFIIREGQVYAITGEVIK